MIGVFCSIQLKENLFATFATYSQIGFIGNSDKSQIFPSFRSFICIWPRKGDEIVCENIADTSNWANNILHI